MEKKLVNVSELIPLIFEKVKKFGDINDILTWRTAYPETTFDDVDESFSGDDIIWGERTVEEKAMYVAYMNDPQAVRIDYCLMVEGYNINKDISDSERAWWMWMAGCFKVLKKDVCPSQEALECFFGYTNDGPYEDVVYRNVDIWDVSLIELNVLVKDFR